MAQWRTGNVEQHQNWKKIRCLSLAHLRETVSWFRMTIMCLLVTDCLCLSIVVTTGAIKSCKAPVKSSPPTIKHPVFYRPDALPVAQPTVSKHWMENITSHGLAYPILTWGLPTLLLTTNSSWIPSGRFAMPLISSLMPVSHCLRQTMYWCTLALFCLLLQSDHAWHHARWGDTY